MINLYPSYKPFRNYMRQFGLVPSLQQLWGYSIHVAEKQTLRPGLATGKPAHINITGHLHPWDLEILVREVILNAGDRGSDGLYRWSELATAVNHIRRLEGVPYVEGEERADVMVDLQRLAHRQFRWQSAGARRPAQLVRALKVFGSNELDAKVRDQTGMEMQQLLRLGMAVSGGLLNRPVLSLGTDFSSIGISRETSRAFLERLTCDAATLRARVRQCQQYNDAWLYAAFPLEHTPLIRFDLAQPDLLLCPLPRYLFTRVTSGVFYDIVNSDGFANAYGNAFQNYVGEVVAVTLLPPQFQVVEERPYAETKANLKHGADWIVSDASGHLFIECKTKRLSLGAKSLTDHAAVAKDLAAMSQAIVQNYKNILDAKKGVTTWRSDDLPIYPLIVTLEDWHLFSTHLTVKLHEEVIQTLANEGIDPSIVEQMPYTVTSASELEIALQVIAVRGIGDVFTLKTDPRHRDWGWTGFLHQYFADEFGCVRILLFHDDAHRLLPEFDTQTS